VPRRTQRTVGSSWRGRDGPGPPPSCAWEPASQPGAAGPAWASDEFSGALTRLGSRLLDIGRQSGGSFLFGPAGCKEERLKGVGELTAEHTYPREEADGGHHATRAWPVPDRLLHSESKKPNAESNHRAGLSPVPPSIAREEKPLTSVLLLSCPATPAPTPIKPAL
jgi:hypothetical protein